MSGAAYCRGAAIVRSSYTKTPISRPGQALITSICPVPEISGAPLFKRLAVLHTGVQQPDCLASTAHVCAQIL